MPTLEQFYHIVEDTRAQRFNGAAEESADFVQLLGEAGVGQAEAGSVTKGDIDWERHVLRFRRNKTQAIFYVPIYTHLKLLLQKLESRLGADAPAEQQLFRMKDAKKALAGACRRMRFKHFTQRNIRQVLIRRLWQSGVDYKLIAKWQGHRDGGKLILATYTEIFSANDAEYEVAQLAKIKGEAELPVIPRGEWTRGGEACTRRGGASPGATEMLVLIRKPHIPPTRPTTLSYRPPSIKTLDEGPHPNALCAWTATDQFRM